MSIALLSLFRLFTCAPVDTNITRVKDPEFLRTEPSPACEFIHETPNPILIHTQLESKKPLRVSRIMDHPSAKKSTGRMFISGTMKDVCAELDRLVVLENKTSF